MPKVTATLNGRDEWSLRVIKALEKGMAVKDIPNHFPVTIDQAKILSRYRNMLKKSESHLSKEAYETLSKLGMKALALSKMYRANDWEGMNEVLIKATENTHRDDLYNAMEAVLQKRELIKEIQGELQDLIDEWKIKEKKYQEEFNKLKINLMNVKGAKLKKQVEQEIKELKYLIEKGQEFVRNKQIESKDRLSKIIEQSKWNFTEFNDEYKVLLKKGSEWLFHQDYIVMTNYKLQNEETIPILGLNEKGNIVIIDIYTNYVEVSENKRIPLLRSLSNEYYMLSNDLSRLHEVEERWKNIGILSFEMETIRIEKMAKNLDTTNKIDIFQAARILSKQYNFS